MALDVSDAVAIPVAEAPAVAGAGISELWLVEGWTEVLSPTDRQITLRLSPAVAYTADRLDWATWQPETWDRMRSRTYLRAMEGTAP